MHDPAVDVIDLGGDPGGFAAEGGMWRLALDALGEAWTIMVVGLDAEDVSAAAVWQEAGRDFQSAWIDVEDHMHKSLGD